MQKLVVDSSVIIKWLNQQDEDLLNQADKIMSDAQNEKVSLLAPELAKYETGNALLLSKNLSITEANTILNSLFNLPIQFVDQSRVLASETYEIAKESNITYYDASFMALAQQENAVLVTDNIKHQGKSTEIKVVPLKDY